MQIVIFRFLRFAKEKSGVNLLFEKKIVLSFAAIKRKNQRKISMDANLRLFLSHFQPLLGLKRLRFTPSMESLRT
jgi:hypothetical protein